MSTSRWPAYSAIAGFLIVGLGCLAALALQAKARVPQPAPPSVGQVQPVRPPGMLASKPLPPAAQSASGAVSSKSRG